MTRQYAVSKLSLSLSQLVLVYLVPHGVCAIKLNKANARPQLRLA